MAGIASFSASLASVRVTAAAPKVRRSARTVVRADGEAAAAAPIESAEAVVFFTDKNGNFKKAAPAEYATAVEEDNVYRASTVTGDLPEWAAAASSGVGDGDAGSVGLEEAFAFATPSSMTNFIGSGPEVMNGRLAMMAFVSAAFAELASGKTVGEQVAQEPTGIFLMALTIIGGSLVTICANSEGQEVGPFQVGPFAVGPFTKEVEMMNGRAAMVGFASLVAIEAVKGSALL